MIESSPYDHAISQLADYGLEIDVLDTSGTLQRVRHGEDKPGRKDGWYVAHELHTDSGQVAVVGAYGWWKDGQTYKIHHAIRGLSDEEKRSLARKRKAAQKHAEQARADKAMEASERANTIWDGLSDEGASEYLDRKGVGAYGVRFARGQLVVPVRHSNGRMVGLQWIAGDGGKKFITGIAKRGGFHLIGDPQPNKRLAVAEGYATAATIHAATGWPCAVAFDAGNLSPVCEALRASWQSCPIVICGDDDRQTPGNPGRTKGDLAAAAVGGIAIYPDLPDGKGTDWNDLLTLVGEDGVKEQIRTALKSARAAMETASGAERGEGYGHASIESGNVALAYSHPAAQPGRPVEVDWTRRFLLTENGKVAAKSFNVRLILENDIRWTGVLGHCDFSYRIMKKVLPPLRNAARGEWSNGDSADLRHWCAENYGFEPRTSDVDDALMVVSQQNRFHPVCDYLNGLRWDGRRRLATWLIYYLGAVDQDEDAEDTEATVQAMELRQDYLRIAGTKWMISAVARVLGTSIYPAMKSVKVDTVLILEGDQGKRKSTAFAVLAGDEWFTDSAITIGDKDAYENIRGKWLVEMAELDSFNKAESTKAKQFFGSKTDRFRPPYLRRAEDFPRQCAFVGTTNQDAYFKDFTGNRRYWPVKITQADMDKLERDRDQLWAEAVHLYRQGETWWPADDEMYLFESEQDDRFMSHAWQPIIVDYLKDRYVSLMPPQRKDLFVTQSEIFNDALKMDPAHMRQPEQQQLGNIMHNLGWRRKRRGGRNSRIYGYIPPLGGIGVPGGTSVKTPPGTRKDD